MAQQNCSISGFAGGSSSYRREGENVRPDKTGIYHPASAGTRRHGIRKPTGLKKKKKPDDGHPYRTERIRTGDPVDEALKEIIKMMNLIMDGMKEGKRGM